MSFYQDDYDDYPCLSQQLSLRQQSSTYGLTIIDKEDVIHYLKQEIDDLSELIQMPFDNTLELFIHYNWNADLIHNKYLSDQQEQIKEDLQNQGILNHHSTQQLPQAECPCCYCDQPLYQFSCSHSFCLDCIQQTIQQKIDKEGAYIVKCLQGQCLYRLPFSFLQQHSQKYIKVLCRRFVDASPCMAWCTGADCQKAVKPIDPSAKKIQCECGNQFCFTCKEDLHSPAPCDIIKKWMGNFRKEEADIKWIAINTKTCPVCKQSVERSMGCNYMMCQPPGGCGKAFCYVCSRPWEPEHSDHFNCAVYKENKDEKNDLEKEKEALERYSFYYERFFNAGATIGKVKDKMRKLDHFRSLMFNHFKVTFQESQYLDDCMNELCNALNVLKWCYSLAYEISLKVCFQSNLMNDYQKEFEHSCESLAIHLMKLFDSVSIDSKKKSMLENEDKRQEIHDRLMLMKKEIQQASQKCTQYKLNLVHSFQDGSTEY